MAAKLKYMAKGVWRGKRKEKIDENILIIF
jgi:hypothetical protein